MSSLLDRIRVCEDESLQARVKQALAEEGKKAEVASVVAALVKASPVVGEEAAELSKELGPAITDEEIITYVKSLP